VNLRIDLLLREMRVDGCWRERNKFLLGELNRICSVELSTIPRYFYRQRPSVDRVVRSLYPDAEYVALPIHWSLLVENHVI
jgi:hypothetical protein